MYIRWERRPLWHDAYWRKYFAATPATPRAKLYQDERKARLLEEWGTASLVARLVESRRVNGKPRQRTVAYLGSIRDTHVEDAGCRGFFWCEADRRLSELGLSDDERGRIDARLSAVVPRPTLDEVLAVEDWWRANAARREKQLGAPGGGRRLTIRMPPRSEI